MKAGSAGRRLFSFPFPLSAYPKAPASRHKMAVSCYQIHYTVRSDICKVLSCGQACIFLQHLASLARNKAVSAFSKAHLPGQQGGNAAAHQDLARNVQLPRLARFVAAHAKRLLLRPPQKHQPPVSGLHNRHIAGFKRRERLFQLRKRPVKRDEALVLLAPRIEPPVEGVANSLKVS